MPTQSQPPTLGARMGEAHRGPGANKDKDKDNPEIQQGSFAALMAALGKTQGMFEGLAYRSLGNLLSKGANE